MARYKVLHFYPDFGAMGGIERYIVNVCQALKADPDFEPVVVCSYGTRLYQALNQAGVLTYGIKTWAGFVKPILRVLDAPTIAQLFTILVQEHPDVVHLHIGQVENLWMKWAGFPLVYTFHGYGPLYHVSPSAPPLKRRIKERMKPLFSLLVPHLERLLFVSRTEQHRMQTEGYLPPGYPGEVLYNGIHIDTLIQEANATDRRTVRRMLDIPDEARCVAFINRLDDNKNPLGFLEMAHQLAKNPAFDDVYFLIAGDGPLQQQVEDAVAASPIHRRLRLRPYYPQVAALLASIDLAVFMPYMEGFGLGVLEAIATRTPLMATAAGGIAEILDCPAGREVMVPPGSPDALAEKAAALLQEDPTARQARLEQLALRAREFDFSVFIRQLKQVYRDVCQANR